MLTFEIALIAHAIFALSLLEYLAVSLRLDHQPLFEKGARAPPGGTRTRHERAAEIEPMFPCAYALKVVNNQPSQTSYVVFYPTNCNTNNKRNCGTGAHASFPLVYDVFLVHNYRISSCLCARAKRDSDDSAVLNYVRKCSLF